MYEVTTTQYNNYEAIETSLTPQKAALEEEIGSIVEELNFKAETKRQIYEDIYKKYFPFIQEGSWIDESYFDEDLYYVDAETTLYASAYPQVSYSLSVVDIGALEEFKAYQFQPGDITFVEDTEFFGWEDDDITPTHLKVYISEIKENLDDPTASTITIQNYLNDFDTLFQKMSAATQTLQYKEGVYNRAGRIVSDDGKVTYESIADTLKISPVSLENIGAQSVTVGEDGITVTDQLQPNNRVRIIGGGIYISTNNGEDYVPVITGAGTNSSKLTAGQIDAGSINIVDGNFSRFRWDGNGINAYWYDTTGNITSIDYKKFVRFDRFGLYGYHDDTMATLFKPQNIDEVINNDSVLFALT